MASAREPLHFGTPGEMGIAPARVDLYRQRMNAAGCRRIDVWSDGSVLFNVGSWGLAYRGWTVSLLWSRQQPTPLLPTIDGFRKSATGERAYGALGDDWYAAIVW